MLTPGPAIALRAAYVAQLRALFVEPALLDAPAAPAPASDGLAARAEQFVQTSQAMGGLLRTSLTSADLAVQQLAELDLLTHAAAGLESARCLLAATPPATLDSALLDGVPDARAPAIPNSLSVLADQFEAGPSLAVPAGLLDAAPTTAEAAAAPVADLEQVRQQLAQQASQAVDSITARAVSVATAGIQDLLLLNGPTILAGVKLLGSQAQALLGESVAAIAGLVRRLAESAISLLAQALDSVLALVGADAQARTQVGTWFDQIRSQIPSPSAALPIVTPLVRRILASEAVKHDVEQAISHSDSGSLAADPTDRLDRVRSAVEKLPPSYDSISQRVTQVLSIVTLVKVAPLVSTPQGQVVVAAVLTGLVGYALYSGYCHVDTGRISFGDRFGFDIPERTIGVRATVMRTLSGTTSD
jgi:hypothetical protein